MQPECERLDAGAATDAAGDVDAAAACGVIAAASAADGAVAVVIVDE